jgi:hypothetical protein
MATIEWQGEWHPFDASDKDQYYLREIGRELQNNQTHPLYNKEARIVGWIPGCDDLLLYLPTENRHVYVHLTWNRENRPSWPHCEFLSSIDAVNQFLQKWGQEN